MGGKGKKPAYFHGDAWYNAIMEKRVKEALGYPPRFPKNGIPSERYKAEFKRQAKLYRQEKQREKELKQALKSGKELPERMRLGVTSGS